MAGTRRSQEEPEAARAQHFVIRAALNSSGSQECPLPTPNPSACFFLCGSFSRNLANLTTLPPNLLDHTCQLEAHGAWGKSELKL